MSEKNAFVNKRSSRLRLYFVNNTHLYQIERERKSYF